ncbi:MAG: hypothetical protein ACREBB_02240 [Nitrosotalea sp.]
MIDPKTLPRIYLDTNHWIGLARIAQGKNNDQTCQKLYSDLIQLRNSNRILIPFSSYIFFEIIKQNNRERGSEMIDFLIDVSQGWFFKPIEKYFKYEILNACYRKLKRPIRYNLSSQLLTNRIDSIIGGHIGKIVPREGHQPSLEEQERAQKIWDDGVKDRKIMKMMLKDEILNSYANHEARIMDNLATKIEQDRHNTYGVSGVVFDKYLKVKWIIELFTPDFAEILYHNKIPREKFFENKEELESLIDDMPALNAFVELSYARDKESKERRVQRNDYYDICHFATALPYANVMIGEKMFTSLSKRQKLDQKNNCVIFHSLSDLAKHDVIKLFG